MRFVFIHAKMTFCFFSKLHLIPSNNNQITRLMTHDKASKVFRSKFFFVLSCRFTTFIIFLRPRTSKIQLIKIIIPKVCDTVIRRRFSYEYRLYLNMKIKNERNNFHFISEEFQYFLSMLIVCLTPCTSYNVKSTSKLQRYTYPGFS